jgi:hypothetical protein
MIFVNITYRLVRLLSLPKLGEIGPVKPYRERFLLSTKHNGPLLKLDYIIYNPCFIEEAHEVQPTGSR